MGEASKPKWIPLLIPSSQAFSAALAITNILGVPFGGFGVPFVSLSEKRAEGFLKVCSEDG